MIAERTLDELFLGQLRPVTVHLLATDGEEVLYPGYAPQRITVGGTDDDLILPDGWIEFPMCTGGYWVATRFCLKRPDGSELRWGDLVPHIPIDSITIPQVWLGGWNAVSPP